MSVRKKRFTMDEGIHTLSDGHSDITTKERKCDGPELFPISADEEKSKRLHASGRVDPERMNHERQ